MLHKGFRINQYMPTELLAVLYKDNAQPLEKRWAALVALGGKPDTLAYEMLLDGLREPDWRLRLFAIEGLRLHPRGRDAADEIVAMLFDVDDQVRQTACKFAGELCLHSAREGLIYLLQSENPDLRDTALINLARIWREEDFEKVFSVYRHDSARGVRIAAAKTLRNKATRHTWKTLFQAWCRDREARHRLWSCELAARFGGRRDITAVRPLLEDRNRNVRQAAERAVTQLAAA